MIGCKPQLLCLLVALTLPTLGIATPGSGSAASPILSSQAWPELPAWEGLDNFTHDYFPRAVYEQARAQTDFEMLDFTYSSDGIPVRGLLIRPRNPGGHKWPVIVFNRGGTGDYARIGNYGVPCRQEADSCLYRVDLYLLAREGFVVIASDYRFHGPTGKRDEWGGADVDDVLNLFPVIRSLDYVDPERAFMFGLSRGGTETYIALRRGAPVKAAAVIAGPSDLSKDTKSFVHGDWFLNGNEWFDGAPRVWKDYEHHADELFRERSAVAWADQIPAPVLIMHARTDRLVPVTQALRMAAALEQKGKVYSLRIYDADGHSLPRHREDRDRAIIDWFNQFGAQAQALAR